MRLESGENTASHGQPVALFSAVVTVRDTGVGIAPDIVPTVFDSLVQGETTIDRSQGGLGLGLAIAKGLVAMHGGEIVAESAGPGCGSTFTIYLPLGDSSDEAASGTC